MKQRVSAGKETIYYHRAYRKIFAPEKKIFVLFLSVILLLESLVFVFFPKLTYLMSSFSREVLLSSIASVDIDIVQKNFLFKPIHVLSLPGHFPSKEFSVLVLVFSLLLMFFISKTRIPKPLSMSVILISSVNVISALFFIFVPHRFPYDLDTFLVLYSETAIVMWFFIPVVLGFALYPLPSSIWSKALLIVATVCYSIVFNMFRYIVCTYVLWRFTYLFTATFYFCFGVLIDVICIVGLYALYMSMLSKRIQHDLTVWRWSY